MADSPFSTFKSDHQVVSGLLVITVGLFGIAASVTGSLASVLASLFDPSILSGTDASYGNSTNTPAPAQPGLLSSVGGTTTNVPGSAGLTPIAGTGI